MILEVATLDIKTGMETDFEAAFNKAQHIIRSMKGYISHQLQKSLDKDHRYILLVQWETLEDHTQGFRGSPKYKEWQKLLHHFYEPFPEVEHYQLITGDQKNS